VSIELPALRTHKEDIGLLADVFLKMHGGRLGRSARLSKEALAALEAYDWPGNVRELRNALERSVVMCRADEVLLNDLPGEVVSGQPLTRKESGRSEDIGMGDRDFREAKRKFEVAWIIKELVSHRWNVSRTAATIGLHRQSLQEKLRELGIRRPGREAIEEDGDL
jgi:DNA-binding NtrC family response regulator